MKKFFYMYCRCIFFILIRICVIISRYGFFWVSIGVKIVNIEMRNIFIKII